MKKLFVLFMIVITMLSFTACGKTGECDSCGQVEKLKEYKTSYGEVEHYCNDCYRMAKIFS